MMKTTTLLALAALVTTACSASNTGPGGDTTDPLTIVIQDNIYVPATKAITVGQTITWSWQGSNQHSVTFSDGPTSEIQGKGSRYTRNFTAPGTYTYHCLVHGTAMSGTITVTTSVTTPVN